MGIKVIFDGPPSHESGRFVEVHNLYDEGIKIGEWNERDDGLWELVIKDISGLPKMHNFTPHPDDSNFCNICGKYLTHDIHFRVARKTEMTVCGGGHNHPASEACGQCKGGF